MAFFKKLLKKNRNVVILFCIVGFALYVNTFPNKMFWDDEDNVLFNTYVQDWKYFPKYFTENVVAGRGLSSNYWRPVVLMFWSLEWHLWEGWAPGYHFAQMILHITAASLLFFALLSLFNRRVLALLAALVFLVHPVQTEAITYATGTSDPLSSIFVFLAIIFYLRFRRSGKPFFSSRSYWVALLIYPILLMTRETTIILIAQLALVDFVFLCQKQASSFLTLFKKISIPLSPHILVASFYLLLRGTVLNFQNTFNIYEEQNEFTVNPIFRLFTFFRVVSMYIQTLFWPFGLHMEREVEIAKSLFAPDVLSGGILLLGSLILLLIFAWKYEPKYSIPLFGIAWLWFGLFPTSNLIIPVNGLMFEHWLYLPIMGFALTLIWLAYRAIQTAPVPQSISLPSFLFLYLLLLLFFSVRTIQRNKEWRDPVTFYNQVLEYSPNSYRIVNNLGMAYADKNDHMKAEETYKRAISLQPSNAVAHHNLGNTYKGQGKYDLAAEEFKTAIKLQPDFFFSYNALADLYLRQGNPEAAREVLNEIKHIDPSL
ncbi:MAG: tetratricopeptide repeat protein [Candidatus Blackburnbacteria bacterium]|nr:tetratricopeptide repeat protein [Candidatus Blackburnbacteria bacterium]